MTAALTPWAVYDWDEIPKVLPAAFGIIDSLDPIFAEPNRLDGTRGPIPFRATVRLVHQSVDGVRKLRDKVDPSIQYSRLVVGDKFSSPIQRVSRQPITGDNGRYSSLDEWTFTI